MRITVPKPEEMTQKPLPKGAYKATYVQHKFVISNNEKKTPMLYVTFSILSAGPNPDEIDATGRKHTEGYALVPAAFFKLNDLYKACTGTDIPAGDAEVEELIARIIEGINGVELVLTLGTKTYQGKESNTITEVSKVQ